MAEKHDDVMEKHADYGYTENGEGSKDPAVTGTVSNALRKDLKGRHMQMIAIGGAIGAGLFVGSASAFVSGGPASVFLGFLIVGIMVYLMMQALAELAVVYPINGAFTMYIVRFIDPSWGFACGWQYAISWLTLVAFEISAACNIIRYWGWAQNINNTAWIIPLLIFVAVVQLFGVKGYGEVEFVLSALKIIACLGFMILGIIINVGGVPGDPRGYLGFTYWDSPYSAFKNGFHGFCSVFVTAAFAYTGAELTGLAAAESENPVKEIPRASNQTIWRIAIFYVVNLLLVGIILPANDPDLTTGSGSRHSPFVLAIKYARINALPSIFNVVILIAVLSVANSSSFGSTRTIQALAQEGMAPKLFAYIDRKGRPVPVVILQLLLGCLAFINLAPNGGEIFTWLLSLSGITILFVYGSIAVAHIRFRAAWKLNGHSLDELPYRAFFGIWGSYVCLLINVVALIAQFYIALYPVGGPNLDAKDFFETYLAGPFIVFLYFCWKVYSWFVYPEHRPLYIKLKDIDIYDGMRDTQAQVSGVDVPEETRRASIVSMQAERPKNMMGWVRRGVRDIF